MKLVELNPRWCVSSRGEIRHGMGISFDCPHCRVERLAVFFANPLDGLPPAEGQRFLWQRAGETFDTLTLNPSIDASSKIPTAAEFVGHWHGVIENGEIDPKREIV